MSKIAVIGLSGESIFLKVDTLPSPSVTTHASSCHIEPGGKGYNQAVACCKNGIKVSYFTKVGCDAYGLYCKEYMDKMGINTKFIIDKKHKTAVATILTDDTGENEVIVYPGASNRLIKEDLNAFEEDIKSSDILLMQYELPKSVIIRGVEVAKQNGVKVVINPAPAKYKEKTILEKADIVTPNFEEVKTLYKLPKGIKVDELGEILKDMVKNILIVTLGSSGCLLVKEGSYKYFDAYKVESVDTTGAGDVFNAGVVSMLNKDLSNLEEAIKYGLAAASLSVTKPFVMDSIPTYEEVVKFQKLYNLKEKK